MNWLSCSKNLGLNLCRLLLAVAFVGAGFAFFYWFYGFF